MSLAARHSYRFGDFAVDTDQKVLLHQGKPLPLSPKLFDTLLVLIENNGRIVQKDELMKQLWPDTFVEEANLTSNILQLRKCLGDSARKPIYIETVARRGYRFIAPVTTCEANELTKIESSGTGRSAPIQSGVIGRTGPNFRGRYLPRQLLAFLAIPLIVIAMIGAWRLRSHSFSRIQATRTRLMLAVLPFKNLTGDVTQDYFSDGLTEEMITRLGDIDSDRLGVIARTSVMRYKNNDESLDRVGRELGVQYVLEGSVRRDAHEVRITAQLIKVADQTHVWAREYNRELKHLLALQDEIAEEVADEIHLTLPDRTRLEPVTQTSSPRAYETYDLYLKGEYFLNKRTPQSLQQAIDYFSQAAAKDPQYARAYAGLANGYALMGGYTAQPQNELMSKARSAALRALEIDDKLPEGHTALALIVQNYDWDWQTADKEYRRAIELSPNFALAHHWYAEHLAFLGRFDEALRESERARSLDPLSLIIATDNGAILYFSRQYDRAIEQLRAVLDMEPNFSHAHIIDYAYVQKGMFSEARADLEKWGRIDDTPWNLAESTYVLGRSGRQLEARRGLEKLKQLNRKKPVDPAVFVWAQLGSGDKDAVFAWLEKAYVQHSNLLATLKVEPAFDPLRSDTRFQDLLRRVGLSP